MVMLKLIDACKVHLSGDVQTVALDRICLEIKSGEYVAITGPSGCGKSTLLGLLGLLDVPDSGSYIFEGHDIVGMSETNLNQLRCGRVGFIFQSFNLIEELSVAENIGLALEYGGLPARERKSRVDLIMEKLGVSHRARHFPSQLSGGQQQRVAIARALVAAPAILLADEPTGNLDKAHGDEVMRLLEDIHREGTTVVMVTHSQEHAQQATRVVHMVDGQIVLDERKAI
jgi:putative ABC transport system ATP-binding protein